jgi:hypothetical protein
VRVKSLFLPESKSRFNKKLLLGDCCFNKVGVDYASVVTKSFGRCALAFSITFLYSITTCLKLEVPRPGAAEGELFLWFWLLPELS